MSYIKKIITSALSVMLAVPYVGVVTKADEVATISVDNAEFDALLYQDFVDTISSDYLSAHFYVRDWDAYGIEKPEVTVGSGPSEEVQDAIDEAEKMIAKLKEFDYDSLSARQQHDYDAVMFAYEDQLNRSQYWQYSWVFSPSDNIVANLSTNMTEFVFYETQDFYDYVTILGTIPAYLDECLKFTEKQVAEGYFMSDSALEESLDELALFLEKTDTNPIIVDFENDVDATTLLQDGEKVDLKTQTKEIVINQILPQVQTIYDYLETKKGTSGNQSLYYMDNGLDYYKLNLSDIAATAKSLQEQYDELDDFVNTVLTEYISLLQTSGDDIGTVGLTDADTILQYLSTHVTEYGFPEIPDVSYTADYLDPSVVSGNVLAYYMTSPIDDYSQNSIKINGANISDANLLYTTLAHEGYPGHLYQHVYYYASNPNPLRTICSFLGYTEGWAMFAQVHATTWNVLSETDARMLILEDELNYALCALIDIGVNGFGWKEKDIAKYLNSVGLNTSIASIFYEQTLIYPGDYNSYGYGLARLVQLEDLAKEQLGDDFDLETFIRIILDDGPRTLDSVEEDVKAYIADVNPDYGNTNEPVINNNTSDHTMLWIVCGVSVVIIICVVALTRKRRNGKK